MLGAKPVYQLGHQRADARLRAGRQALLRVPEGSPGGLHGVITHPPHRSIQQGARAPTPCLTQARLSTATRLAAPAHFSRSA